MTGNKFQVTAEGRSSTVTQPTSFQSLLGKSSPASLQGSGAPFSSMCGGSFCRTCNRREPSNPYTVHAPILCVGVCNCVHVDFFFLADGSRHPQRPGGQWRLSVASAANCAGTTAVATAVALQLKRCIQYCMRCIGCL